LEFREGQFQFFFLFICHCRSLLNNLVVCSGGIVEQADCQNLCQVGKEHMFCTYKNRGCIVKKP
jgi:hypothetical protein